MLEKEIKRQRRKNTIRAKIFGTEQRPRLSIFRSLKHIYAQIIDDNKKITLVSSSDKEVKDKKDKQIDQARKVGEILAQKASKKGIKSVVFDRSGYKYHGIIKTLAEEAKKKGLKF